jgi:hypothetical protein
MILPIENRVSESSLVNLDLESFYPEGKREFIDISQWLDEGYILREKEFRTKIKDYKWTQHENNYIAIGCSTGAILPAWAPLLVTSHIEPFAKKIVFGNLDELENKIFDDIIRKWDLSIYKDKAVMIKGCSEKSIPYNAYVQLIIFLKSVAKSLFYGEACSSVPIWKRPK